MHNLSDHTRTMDYMYQVLLLFKYSQKYVSSGYELPAVSQWPNPQIECSDLILQFLLVKRSVLRSKGNEETEQNTKTKKSSISRYFSSAHSRRGNLSTRPIKILLTISLSFFSTLFFLSIIYTFELLALYFRARSCRASSTIMIPQI